MLPFTLTPARQKVLFRCSLVLNLCLFLYLSLLAGWNGSSSSSSSSNHPTAPYARDIQVFVDGAENVPVTPPPASSSSSPCPPVVPAPSLPTSSNPDGAMEIADGVTCFNKESSFRQSPRGQYWVLYNYITAEKRFRCNESITYTTHGDFTFLDNLEPLLERWQGPLSVSVYAPGTDLNYTLETILYLRDCSGNSLVRDFVTFHIYFDLTHIPAYVPDQRVLATKLGNCSYTTDWEAFETYRKQKKLTYPVNVARNVARETSTTHFVFPSDIELYPSPDLIPSFLEMIKRNEGPGTPGKPRVYVNSIFEIQENVTALPTNKEELVEMLRSQVVIPFHKLVCKACHNIPHAKKWVSDPVMPGMRVLGVGKRVRPFQHWEPIYIGTNQEPEYDERLSWEGRSDKMIQGYKMCVLDYEFHILDNAFLLHRPGIKTKKTLQTVLNTTLVAAQNELIRKTILPQIKTLYGTRKGCELL